MVAGNLLAQSVATPKSECGFRVVGNHMLDPEGRPFIVKGIASPYGPFCGGVDDWDSANTVDRDYDLIQRLGCNFVRICVTYKVAHGNAKRAQLIAVVAKARARFRRGDRQFIQFA